MYYFCRRLRQISGREGSNPLAALGDLGIFATQSLRVSRLGKEELGKKDAFVWSCDEGAASEELWRSNGSTEIPSEITRYCTTKLYEHLPFVFKGFS